MNIFTGGSIIIIGTTACIWLRSTGLDNGLFGLLFALSGAPIFLSGLRNIKRK